MKHALLILAHNNIHHIKEIIQFLDEKFFIYIHIDKKSKIKIEDYQILRDMPNVRWIGSCYSINWGGYNVLRGVLKLMRVAINDGISEYYHLISGQDFPTKTIDEFNSFFEHSKGTEYLNYFRLPYEGWDEGRMDRLTLYCLFDYFNFKKANEKKIIYMFDDWQKRHHICRKLPLKRYAILYGGSCWWSLTKECVQYVVEETNRHPSLYHRLRFTFAPDEVYVQTILLNSPFQMRIENNNLRYISWEFRNGNNPAILDETDFSKIIESNVFFARKIDYPISESLIEHIKKRNGKV